MPSTGVGENDFAFAFRDINPQAPTHILVIPKYHIENAHEISADDFQTVGSLFSLAQQVARSDGVDSTGYRLVYNVGEHACNSVGHLHMHVIGGRQLSGTMG